VLGLALVTVVSTVILSVTNIGFENTLVIVTLVVVRGTVDGATGGRLITLVLTICRAITIPALGHTDATFLALELRVCVTLVGSQHWAALLVTAIVTVRDAIAFVRLMDTLLQIATLELGGRTGDGRTSLLVSVVKTVIVPVTSPRLRDARAAALARELEIFTSLQAAALSLVRQVSAVVFSVTFPSQRNASAVPTAELRGLASHISAAGLV